MKLVKEIPPDLEIDYPRERLNIPGCMCTAVAVVVFWALIIKIFIL